MMLMNQRHKIIKRFKGKLPFEGIVKPLNFNRLKKCVSIKQLSITA